MSKVAAGFELSACANVLANVKGLIAGDSVLVKGHNESRSGEMITPGADFSTVKIEGVGELRVSNKRITDPMAATYIHKSVQYAGYRRNR